jgi:AraC family transcriptional regulator
MKSDTRSFYEQAVRRAIELVTRNLDGALDLNALAREAALSPFHFHRVFRGMVGETPLELHRRLRMERAAARLIETDTPVTTIAFDAGYETHETFTRAFRAAFGCAPSEFRRQRDDERVTCQGPIRTSLAARSGIHFVAGPRGIAGITFLTGDAPMNVEIVSQPALRAATLRHIGPYNRISEAFGKLGEIAGRAGFIGPDTIMLAIYHDDPETTPESELRSDAALTVASGRRVPEGLTEMTIAAGQYARTIHRGPYEGLPDTWARLMGEWLPRSAHRVGDGVSYEVYRNTPMDTAPEELVTEIYVPLA